MVMFCLTIYKKKKIKPLDAFPNKMRYCHWIDGVYMGKLFKDA